MLTEEEIRRALHAKEPVSLGVANPHGPLGLEQLAAAVATHRKTAKDSSQAGRVRWPIELPLPVWEKLQTLAAATSQAGASPLSAGELAAAIIEQYVLDAGA